MTFHGILVDKNTDSKLPNHTSLWLSLHCFGTFFVGEYSSKLCCCMLIGGNFMSCNLETFVNNETMICQPTTHLISSHYCSWAILSTGGELEFPL